MTRLKTLGLVESWSAENAVLSNYVKEKFSNKGVLNILEAGCGQKWPLDLKGLEYVLTGVDIDKASLETRKEKTKDLDKIILADLRTILLKESECDIIYSSFVLEPSKVQRLS